MSVWASLNRPFCQKHSISQSGPHVLRSSYPGASFWKICYLVFLFLVAIKWMRILDALGSSRLLHNTELCHISIISIFVLLTISSFLKKSLYSIWVHCHTYAHETINTSINTTAQAGGGRQTRYILVFHLFFLTGSAFAHSATLEIWHFLCLFPTTVNPGEKNIW